MQAMLTELCRRDKTYTISFLVNTEFLCSRKKGCHFLYSSAQ